MGSDETTRLDVKQLLADILKKLGSLEEKIDGEIEARRDLSESATETLTNYGAAIAGVQQGTFAMLSMHIDIVGPRRKHSDPEVAAEAETHAQMAMEAQAWVAPTLFENLYGVSAETGEPLPGRVPGVALKSADAGVALENV
ncbi:hypothetical protein AB0O58_19860 [Rhodococcus sp. NPDC080181]|jgi:hypothetical protein|uniref:hypothetical protein n=1 Tax=Rhodococcus sp. NPDC080181 TaxID=3155292 RepID=UPI00344FB1BE